MADLLQCERTRIMLDSCSMHALSSIGQHPARDCDMVCGFLFLSKLKKFCMSSNRAK